MLSITREKNSQREFPSFSKISSISHSVPLYSCHLVNPIFDPKGSNILHDNFCITLEATEIPAITMVPGKVLFVFSLCLWWFLGNHCWKRVSAEDACHGSALSAHPVQHAFKSINRTMRNVLLSSGLFDTA